MANAWEWGAVVGNHAEAEADGEQQAREIVEMKRLPASRGGECRFDSVPHDQNGRECAKQVLPHGIEEAEVLRQQVIDGLKDELEIVHDHETSALRVLALGHSEGLQGIGNCPGDLGQVDGEIGVTRDVGVDGIGRGFALLLGGHRLLFEKGSEEFVGILGGA